VELLRQPAEDDTPGYCLARVNGAVFPVTGYEIVGPGEDGNPSVLLSVAAESVAVGDRPRDLAASAPATPVNLKPALWGSAELPDPRSNMPGYPVAGRKPEADA
jgi:hypothetical protein